MKTDGIRDTTAKRDRVAWPGQGDAPPVLFWASWPPSLTSCASNAFRDKMLTLEKSQVNLSSGRSLKFQNTQNRFSCFTEL
jgi:hypothetical protein